MDKKWVVIIIILVSSLTACSQYEPKNIEGIDASKLDVIQIPSEQAEAKVKGMDEVTEVIAVNMDKKLLLAFRVKQFEKFRLNQIEKKVEEELKKDFKEYDMTVSSDLKIYLETTKIKNDVYLKKIDESKVEKEMERVIKLSEEQT
ncbi:hypothetical protein IMZ08_15380 [Bacillus luteolus]|uniref:Sporulation protein n=1 Tax=Litchfieldia luteola TaxID=682179 RepID=A0ABR9QLR0_9BACI|nr:hypothetical protein [Cytobacillus luteolus]MBE4909433.1 hypothetical protein [Cytobacillus luteolus]MBP1940833.1 hypothetical protein [Cytobacillus luteolus]